MKCTRRKIAACLLVVGLIGSGLAPDRSFAVTTPAPSDKPLITIAALHVEPARFTLSGKWSSQAILVVGQLSDGTVRDFSAAAEFKSANPAIAEVGKDGIVRPVADGDVPITVSVKLGDSTASVQVVASVKEAKNEAAFFLRNVMPLLVKSGCNSAQCHAGARGRGELKLSMFGADPHADYDVLIKTNSGRLINKADPLKSILLLKATGGTAHTGGAKITSNSPDARMLAAWMSQGAAWGDDKLHRVAAVKIVPQDRRLPKGDIQQMSVRAVYADGSERDVTRSASLASSDPAVASVDPGGKVKAEGCGEVVVTATFMRQSDAVRIVCPQPLPKPFPKIEPNNRIDELVMAKLQKLGFPPSEVCSEEAFLRRAYLDVIGILPKPGEARTYLADPDPAKRNRLIDRLLERSEYADFWALKWGDLLRIKSEYPVRVWPRGVLTYYKWVRESIAANKPYDQFVRELITANGSNFRIGPANYYRAVQQREPRAYAENTAVLFLGARMDCARCHGHPRENWGQDDGLAMAAFFSKVAIKTTQEWKEEIVYFNPSGGVYHPATKQYVTPKFLGGEVVDMPHDQDPRLKFADWLTSPRNPWFAKVMANRVWYWLLGRGIVHEPDDFRTTNPPSNPELLDYLAQEFVGHNFDAKHLFRLILQSKTYQLSSKTNDLNRLDARHFSHYYVRRIGAEQMLDAVCQVTGTTDQFASWIPVPATIMPAGSHAAQVFDGDIKNPLLDLFGRPPRDTPYECERKSAGSIRQSLHLVNSDHLEGKVASSPNLARLLQANKPDAEILDELYLAALSRPARADERQRVLDYLSGAGKPLPPQLAADVKAAEDALAKARAALGATDVAYQAAEKPAKEAESVLAVAFAAMNQAAATQKAAEDALPKILAQVSAPNQARPPADKAAQDMKAVAAWAKTQADSARTAHATAVTAATQKRKAATDAKAARDKADADEKAAAARVAEAAKKLADATAALKPPRQQAFQDVLWALLNTKEFLFNH